MTHQTFTVSGMTCDHCANAVTSEIQAIVPGAGVTVELGEPSTVVVSDVVITDEQMREALDEAGGYQLLDPS